MPRDNLHNDLEKLREEQRHMENDLSNIQIRWHTVREEKVRAANTLRDVKKAEEELDNLLEQKSMVELDEKVNESWTFFLKLIERTLDACVKYRFLACSDGMRSYHIKRVTARI